MAASPRFKIFNPQGGYIASCVHLEDAAALAALYGDGAQVRDGHQKQYTLWTEGAEQISAGESYDMAAAIMQSRIDQRAACSMA